MFLVFSCCHSDLSVTHIMKRHVLGYMEMLTLA